MTTSKQYTSGDDLFAAVHDFVTRTLEGQVTQDDVDRFEELLRDNPEAESLYIEYLRTTVALPGAMARTSFTGQPEAEATPAVNLFAGLADAVHWTSHPWRFFAVVMVLTMLTWSVFYVAMLSGTGKRNLQHGPIAAGSAGREVARIVEMRDVRWNAASETPVNSRLHVGDQLEFSAGLMQIEYRTGVRLIVEGPAALRIDGPNKVGMDVGRLAAEVATAAVGFRVDTPAATIVDLGTEFATVVEQSHACDVFVYQGTIEVEPLAADGRPSGAKHRLVAGQSLRISAERTVEPNAASDPEQIVRRMPQVGNGNGSDAYAQAVLASKPLAYWRFEETQGDRAADASGNGNHAEYGEKVWRGVRGVTGKTFSGFESGNCAAGFPGKTYRPDENLPVEYNDCVIAQLAKIPDDYSVELWVYSARRSDDRDVSGYFFSRGANQQRDSVGDHLSIRGAFTPLTAGHIACYNGVDRRASLVSRSALRPQRWYYVVLVRQDDNIRVYLDGEETPQISGPADCSLLPDSSRIYVGIRNDGMFSFRGRIDEVAIYDRPLSLEEVAGHYTAAVGEKTNGEGASGKETHN